MSWDYAELSKLAKKSGGPEKLVETIESMSKEVGRREGRMAMVPYLGAMLGVGSIVTLGIMKVVQHLKKKKEISQLEVEKAKKELIEGIKKFDAEHTEACADSIGYEDENAANEAQNDAEA